MGRTVVLHPAFLFEPAEVELFNRWQMEARPEHRHDMFPYASEYEDYLSWRRESSYALEDPGLIQDTSSEVSHAQANEAEDSGDKPCRPHADPTESAGSEASHACADQNEDMCGEPLYEDAALDIENAEGESQRARICKHPLHPGHPGMACNDVSLLDDNELENGTDFRPQYCPVCSIYTHFNLLTVVMNKWKDAGGPWEHAGGDIPDKLTYVVGTRAYHRVKTQLLRFIDELEKWSEAETIWEILNPEEVDDETKQRGATAALAIFKEGYLHDKQNNKHYEPASADPRSRQFDNTDSLSPPSFTTDTRSRKVSFALETPHNELKRRPGYYHRSSPSYDSSSPHSCEDSEGYVDTSFRNDHFFAVSQCRILYTTESVDLEMRVYRDLNIGPSYGDNEHVRCLKHLLMRAMTRDFTLEEAKNVAARLENFSGIFLVWQENEEGEIAETCDEAPVVFNKFRTYDRLEDTPVVEWARQIGDLEKEEEDPMDVDDSLYAEEVKSVQSKSA